MPQELISSAQNREDLYLHALIGHIKNGFYVDVGANHAELHSVTKMFYDKGWKGVNIEPNPILYKELKSKRRRDINLNLGASDRNGKLKFRTYPQQDGLSTFSEEIMKLHEKEGLTYEDSIVPIKTLGSILKAHRILEIDFMKIDVEGYEAEVILGNDWERFRPKVLVIEATVRHRVDPILVDLNYRIEFFDGLNNYYVDNLQGDDISIHNYAGRVLSGGVYSQREIEALQKVDQLEENLIDASRNLEKALIAFNNLQGLKNSIKHSIRSAHKFTKKQLVVHKKSK